MATPTINAVSIFAPLVLALLAKVAQLIMLASGAGLALFALWIGFKYICMYLQIDAAVNLKSKLKQSLKQKSIFDIDESTLSTRQKKRLRRRQRIALDDSFAADRRKAKGHWF